MGLGDAGTGTLTVTASGVSQTFDLVLAPSGTGHAKRVPRGSLREAVPGHRAGGAGTL
jgi:hypothetical protein